MFITTRFFYTSHHRSYFLRFPFYIGLTLITILVIFSIWACQQYLIQQEKIVQDLKAQTAQLQRSYKALTDHTSSLMHLITTQIDPKHLDSESINNILVKFQSSSKFDNMYVWTTFSWVDKDNYLRVTSFYGIAKTPVNLSTRDYLHLTKKTPNKLFLGAPVMSQVSNRWITPGGIGIKDHDRYIGTVSVGLDTALLANHLQHAITQDGVYFILLDKDFHEVPGMQTGAAPFTLTPPTKLPFLSITPFSHRDSYYITPINNYPYYLYVGYNWHMVSHTLWQNAGIHLVEIAIIGLVLLMLLSIIYYHIIKPVVTLSYAADNITKGNLDIQLPQFHSVEINNLAQQLQNITKDKKSLRDIHHQLQIANNSLEQKVATRTASLQEALNAKDEFLRNMSHEIRTPISSIEARTGLLLDFLENFSHDDIKKSIEDIQLNSRRLFQLLNDLLDLSKQRTGKMIYDMQENNLLSVVEEISEECLPLFKQKHLTLQLQHHATTTFALFDKMRIGQVVRNLLSNACKYTPTGVVVITLHNSDIAYEGGRTVKGVALSITDSGVGIPADELQSIFQIFVQSSTTKHGGGGTGLGLALCQEIILAHQGKIWAANNDNGLGSTFTFIIPIQD